MSTRTPAERALLARTALRRTREATPALVVDADAIERNVAEMRASWSAFPDLHLLVSTAGIPSPAVWRQLDQLGLHFIAATPVHAELLRRHGISSDRIRSVPGYCPDWRLDRAATVRVASATDLGHLGEADRPRVDVAVSFDVHRSPSALAASDALGLLKEAELRHIDSVDLTVQLGSTGDVDDARQLVEGSPLPVHCLVLQPLEIVDADLRASIESELLHRVDVEQVGIDVTLEVLDDAATFISSVRGVSPQTDRVVAWIDAERLDPSASAPVAFDREVQILEPTSVVTTGAASHPREVALPVDVEAGELLAWPGRGDWGRSNVVVARSRWNELADFGIVLPGDPDFPAVEAIEFESFEAAGLLGQDGTVRERRFADRCRMLVVRNEQSEISGVMRVADASSLGFEALHYCELGEAGLRFVNEADLDGCVEVLTLAPLSRDPVAAYQLYLSVLLDSLSRGRPTIIALMLEPVWRGVNRHLGRDGYGPFVRLGPTEPKLGLTPLKLDIWECEKRLELTSVLAAKVERLTEARERRLSRRS